jgi:hypothetical protein
VRSPPDAVAADRGALKREVLTLVLLVVVVDAVFIGFYLAFGMDASRGPRRLAFTVMWTVVTLAVVLRSLGRIRAARLAVRRHR